MHVALFGADSHSRPWRNGTVAHVADAVFRSRVGLRRRPALDDGESCRQVVTEFRPLGEYIGLRDEPSVPPEFLPVRSEEDLGRYALDLILLCSLCVFGKLGIHELND